MKITHLSNTPLSNAPANLAYCQKHYGHDSELYLMKKSAQHRQHSAGHLWAEQSPEFIRDRITTSDVIHFHNYAFEQNIFKVYPDLVDVIKAKPHVIQYHSDRHSVENFETTLKDPTMRKAVIAQYHVRIYPECEFIVPNVIPIFDKRYTAVPVKYEDPTITVSYSPSNTSCKGWDNKGWTETKNVLDKLEAHGKLISQVLYQVPYEDCIAQKRWAHIGIDEVMTGSYHLSSLEYAAMGAIPVARLDEQTIAAMRTVVGDEGIQTMPWLISDSRTLEARLLEKIREGRQAVFEQGKKARYWMEKFWNPENHVKIFDRMYASL